MIYITSIGEMPTANVCIKKSRVKQYKKQDTPVLVYLKDGTEFEIELFNPTKRDVLAKINLNGACDYQNGIVLRPGERIFLDRFLDVQKKFRFDTYEVKNNKQVKKAIEDNGRVLISFYEESNVNPYVTYNPIGCFNFGNYTYTNGTIYTNNDYSTRVGFCDSPWTLTTSNTNEENSTKIETGKIEYGGESNQEFIQYNKNFNSWSFHEVEYKILPLSQKVTESKDLNVRQYCSECGSRVKKTHKFCSHCGTKI